jgi:microcystin-dependent protein
MADQYIGEIRIFAGNFPPKGWAFCNGSLLSISQNTALFSLLGTTYGGDGRTNFALPNLSGAAPMHPGQGAGLTSRTLGETGGSQSVTLTSTEMPLHNHSAMADGGAGTAISSTTEATVWGTPPNRGGSPLYAADSAPVAMSQQALQAAGGSQAHNNMQPYLGVSFIIALEGYFPPRD